MVYVMRNRKQDNTKAKETIMTASEAREINAEYAPRTTTATATRPASYRCYCGGTRRISGAPDLFDGTTPYTCNACGRTARH